MAACPLKAIDLSGFEEKFRETIDPWDYRTSCFEARKRGELLRACGPGKLGRGLELACAIGETSRALLSRCLTLTATDGASTALAEARRRTPPNLRITFRQGVLPRDVPRGPFDLIVVSEIAYYLSRRDVDDLARRLVRQTASGGRIVVLHHVIPFADAAQLPASAHERLCGFFRERMVPGIVARYGRYRIDTFRQSRAGGKRR